eukprot:COSAG02_NODE_1976_length_10205_cov_59.713141_4_plen_1338_part_00
MSTSARELRKAHARHASNAVSTVVVRNIETASAHELSVRSALVPMGKIKEVNLMELEGDRQSWALVTFADEASAKRSASKVQRKAYGCTVSLSWKVSMVPVVEMLKLQMHFMPASLDDDSSRVKLIREAFDKGISPTALYTWRTSPESLAKAQHDESERRLLEIEAINAGKTVKQIVAPSASEVALGEERRKKQLERRKKVLGYEALVDESSGARHWGGDTLNRLVRDIGRQKRVPKAWTVPAPTPSTSELQAESERLKVAASSLRVLSKLTPTRKPTPPPPKPKKRRLAIQLPNAVQAPTWPRSTGLGRSNPRVVFDVPHRNPYEPNEAYTAAKRGKIRAKWKGAIQSSVNVIAGWRHDDNCIVVTDPAIVQLLILCGVSETHTSAAEIGRKQSSKSGFSGRGSRAVAENVELRVPKSMLRTRTVFQKLVLYAVEHPNLKPLLDSLREGGHEVKNGPWITKLREKTAAIKMSCPDGRQSLRAARGSHLAEDSGDESETGSEPEPGLGHELPDVNAQAAELLQDGDADTALHLIDDWLGRHNEAGGHPPERHPSTGPEVHLLTLRSKALVATGEYARSNYDAMKLLAIRPSNPRPHVLLAAAHVDRANDEPGEFFRATECLLDATGINPTAVHRQSLQNGYAGVRHDRHYRNELYRAHHQFPTQDFIRSAMNTAHDMNAKDDGPKVHHVQKKYDWMSVDVSDLVMQQHRMRIGLLKMAGDVDGVTPTETNDLLRSMTAEQLPRQMINQVRAMCEDGEIDENDREVLEDLAPPDKFENLSSLVELLESMEQKVLAIFRHYCYLISAGGSGVNERSDAVSSAQFTAFVKDCKMLEGHHALAKSAVDQIFLRAMFLRGGPDGLGVKNKKAAEDVAARQGFLEKRKKEKEADAISRTASLGKKSFGSSHTLGSDGTQRALELYEFTGAMVRLANRRYPNMIGKGLAAKFDRFTDEVLDKMEAGGIHNLEELMASRDIKKVLNAYNTKLTRIFEVFAKADTSVESVLSSRGSKNIRSAAAHTINMKEFEQFAEDAGLVQASKKATKLREHDDGPKVPQQTTRSDGTPFLITRQNLHDVFVEVNLDDDLYDDQDAENEADEIIYDEFNECLVLLSQLQLSQKAAEITVPPPKTFQPEQVAMELNDLLKSMLSELALKRKELRGIDRVRKDDGSTDGDNDGDAEASGLLRLAYEQAATTQGRRAGGVTWTKLPWKQRPSVPLRPPTTVEDSDVRSSGGAVTPEAARPITQRELNLHTVPALEKLARNSKAIPDEDVDEVMKDPPAQKERLIDLLTKAAAVSFREAYIAEHGEPPPADLFVDRRPTGKKATSKKKKAKSGKKKKR